MSNANSIQVGGVHYAPNAAFQAWDYIVATRMGYLEGNATKYIVRHNAKGCAVQDLQKAIHYIDKTIELYNAGLYTPGARPDVLQQSTLLHKLVEVYNLGDVAREAVRQLATWKDWHDLCYARGLAERLLNAIHVPSGDIPKENKA